MKNLLFAIMFMTTTACAQGNRHTEDGASATPSCCEKELPVFDNAAFYTAEGEFNADAAKDAIIRLMNYYAYPVTAKTRDLLWVSDYGTGRFTDVGLAAIMYANNTTDLYMLQDLFLLPHQMLPEHWHEKPAQLPAKMEGWLIRNGVSYVAGEGEDNLASFPEIRIPSAHEGGVTVKNVIKALPGDFVPLSRLYSHHWQFAGAQGAIITEVANVHAGEAVRHQVESINRHFLGK